MTLILLSLPLALAGEASFTEAEVLVATNTGCIDDVYGNLAAMETGGTLASFTDVNGDGTPDLVAVADEACLTDVDVDGRAGMLVTWFGAASGIDPTTETQYSSRWDHMGGYFGAVLASPGDLDGDGFDDLVAEDYSDAHLVFGGASGFERSREIRWSRSDENGHSGDNFGSDIASAGDVNADGHVDLIIGAKYDGALGDNAGAAYVYLGSSDGIDTANETKLLASDGEAWELAGESVSGAGDVDGDGYDDVLMGIRKDEHDGSLGGTVRLYRGGPGGVDADDETLIVASDSSFYDKFGVTLADLGDLDGDGYDDLAVGATSADAGVVYIYPGSASGPDSARELKLTPSDGPSGYEFGSALAAAGDLDGDGHADLAVASKAHEAGLSGSGSVYVYFGDGTGLDPDSEVRLHASDSTEGDGFATALAGLGDIDGDGFGELAIGAPLLDIDGEWDQGQVYVFTCGETTWYADHDGDGHGDDDTTEVGCRAPNGYVADGGDCDDDDPNAWPEAEEVPDDGVDQDCDGEDLVTETEDTGTAPADTGTEPTDTDTEPADTGTEPSDTEPTDTGAPDTGDAAEGCGCSTGAPFGSSGAVGFALVLCVLLRRGRHRRRGRDC